MAHRQWRVREARCAPTVLIGRRSYRPNAMCVDRCSRGSRSALALADLLHGRDINTLTTSFEDIWKMSLRVLDDIKVRPNATCA